MSQILRYLAAGLMAASPALAQAQAHYPGEPTVPDDPVTTAAIPAQIKAYNLSVPLDHFHNDTRYEPHSNETFNLRYYVDTTHYKPGGPVIVLASGETSATNRIEFLDHGIAAILAKATNGVGIILEHRYYGTSWPVPDSTLANMRFLSTEQALADTDYFARHVQIPGLEKDNVTAPNAPWIIYGGSYAGAFAALTRKLYPDTYWGAISSSGVTAAIYDYWQYNEAVRLFSPGECGSALSKITKVMDAALFSGDAAKSKKLKALFGLEELQDDEFGKTLNPPSNQDTSWLPEEDDVSFGQFCAAVSSTSLVVSSAEFMRDEVKQFVAAAGYAGKELDDTTTQMLNYVGLQSAMVRDRMNDCKTQHECFSDRAQTVNTARGRAWLYQTCTQWGYYLSGSGVPKDIQGVLSRAVTLEYASIACKIQFNITTPPDVESINKLGGLEFSYPRVAVIDGKQDPWRYATPHATGANPGRKSTVSEPYILIDPGVHHWDESGVQANDTRPGLPPKQIEDVQREEVEFVKAWLRKWKCDKTRRSLRGY